MSITPPPPGQTDEPSSFEPTDQRPATPPNIARIIVIGIGIIVAGGIIIAWAFNHGDEPAAAPPPTGTSETHSQSSAPTTRSETTMPSPTASESSAPSPTPPPDAIMQVDIANGYLPNVLANGDWHFWSEPTPDTAPNLGIPVFHKMPAENADPDRWFAMKDGRSVQVHPEAHLAESGTPATTILVPEPGSETAFGPVLNAQRSAGYHDLNGDGYLDAIMLANCGDFSCWYVAIFDPEDPAHPYVTSLWESQFENTAVSDDGTLTLAAEGCVSARASITGSIPQVTSWQRAALDGPTQCLPAN